MKHTNIWNESLPILRYKRSKSKIEIFGILGKTQKGSILDHFKKSKLNFNSIFGISAKNNLENIIYWEEKIEFPHKKISHQGQNYC